ncbi:MAG: hypothetical protein IIZ80_00140 [Erysipelotrichaceae bacterium]|nr:hypothetical protein [Erysipelotrichaceae bacterium]
MTDVKKTNRLDEMLEKELSLDSLNEVSGGRVKIAGYALLTAMMAQMKALGKNKEYCIQALIDGWETDCKFKTAFTDQTGDDLQKAIDYINKTWI